MLNDDNLDLILENKSLEQNIRIKGGEVFMFEETPIDPR